MKTISKKAFVYIIVGMLTFSSTYMCFYRSVHAMEWVGGALAFEEALKWTLAVLGITATAGMTDAYWEEYGDDFVDYATENGATQTEVAEWQMKLCEGVLDKASTVWTSFKAWAKTLISNNSGSGSSSVSIAQAVDILNNYFGVNYTLNYNGIDVSNFQVTGFNYVYNSNANNVYDVYLYNQSNLTYNSLSSRPWDYGVHSDGQLVTAPLKFNYVRGVPNGSGTLSPNTNSALHGTSTSVCAYGIDLVSDSTYPFTSQYIDLSSDNPLPNDGNFQGLEDVDVENIDVISSDLPDVDNPEVTLPFPGLDTSDDSISSDTYDDIIGAINDGTIDIDDGIDDIISMLKVISYDTETDDVIPPRPDPEDPTKNVKKDDVINENRNNMGFTLAGLENVFPFCIPWDIYAFMTLLVADPVAPEFDFPIKSVNNTTENIHVDLEPFEPVAVVVRYVFDFLFIIGLGMLTRSMIGGGSSD